jgi:hypothetical protein
VAAHDNADAGEHLFAFSYFDDHLDTVAAVVAAGNAIRLDVLVPKEQEQVHSRQKD